MSKIKDKELDELLAELDKIGADEEAEKETTKYIKILRIWEVAILVVFIVSILALIKPELKIPKGDIIVPVLVAVVLIGYFFFLQKRRKYISTILLQDCNVERMLGVQRISLLKFRGKRDRARNFYTMIKTLIMGGYTDLAEKYIDKMAEYGEPHLVRIYGAILKMELYLKLEDFRAMGREMTEMKRINKEERITPDIIQIYRSGAVIYELANKWDMQDYEVLLKMLEKVANASEVTNLARVCSSYYAYRTAQKMGDKEKERTYKDYVIKNGGTTFYKKELVSAD